MKTTFTRNCLLEVVESYDEVRDIVHSNEETFTVGEEVEFDIFDENGDTINIQFPNGDVAYNVPKNLFVNLPETFDAVGYDGPRLDDDKMV